MIIIHICTCIYVNVCVRDEERKNEEDVGGEASAETESR